MRIWLDLAWIWFCTLFKSEGAVSLDRAERFVSIHGAISNLFNVQRRLISRSTLRTFRATAMEAWNAASAAAA